MNKIQLELAENAFNAFSNGEHKIGFHVIRNCILTRETHFELLLKQFSKKHKSALLKATFQQEGYLNFKDFTIWLEVVKVSEDVQSPEKLQNVLLVYFANWQGKSKDSVPREVLSSACYRKIQDLNIGNNQLMELPENIGELKELRSLRIDRNRIHALPTSMQKLKKLEIFILHENELTQMPGFIGELKKLTYLDMAMNRCSTLPTTMVKLVALRTLKLEGNPMSNVFQNKLDTQGLVGLSTMFSIAIECGKSLQDVVDTHDQELAYLDAKAALKVSAVSRVMVEAGIEASKTTNALNLQNLGLIEIRPSLFLEQECRIQSLHLQNNFLSSVPDAFWTWSGIQAVEMINLNDNMFEDIDTGILKLRRLRVLYLRNNRLSHFPNVLHQCNTLRILDIENNPIDQVTAEIVPKNKLSIMISSASSVKKGIKEAFHGTILKNVATEKLHTTLRKLNSNNTQIGKTDKQCVVEKQHMMLTMIPAQICCYYWVQRLNLSNNKLAGIPKEISQLQQLRHLIVRHNLIDHDNISTSLTSCTKLRILDLAYNKLIKFDCLCNIPSIHVLDISYNNVLTIPEALHKGSIRNLYLMGNAALSPLVISMHHSRTVKNKSLNMLAHTVGGLFPQSVK